MPMRLKTYHYELHAAATIVYHAKATLRLRDIKRSVALISWPDFH